jgi:hypothetical protein
MVRATPFSYLPKNLRGRAARPTTIAASRSAGFDIPGQGGKAAPLRQKPARSGAGWTGNFPKRDWENMTRYANKLGKPVLGKVCFRCRILDSTKLLRIETALSGKLNNLDLTADRVAAAYHVSRGSPLLAPCSAVCQLRHILMAFSLPRIALPDTTLKDPCSASQIDGS